MRIGIATVQVPFIRGGAEDLAEGLHKALRRAGYEAELITMPFRFSPPSEVQRSMCAWTNEDFMEMNGYPMDRVICLKFPTYYLRHPQKVVWLLHQHRAVYDLWDTPYASDLSKTSRGHELKRHITRMDTEALASSRRVFTISRNVVHRLKRFNGLGSQALYHPPRLAGRLYSAAAEPYLFYPSRLEGLKRQDLLIEAMRYVRSPVVALLAGDGGQKAQFARLIERLNVGNKVRLLGRLTDAELLGYYGHALAVFFGARDEDYGYVTLEAMLAAKPVITCTDSGGPLEFVEDGETGRVVEPHPERIAEAIDCLYLNQRRAEEMGRAGLARYHALNISWDNVVANLLT
jgi:glycosyltransferase involved in cell wall biosynthesis